MACTTSENNDGKLQNVTNAMQYKKSDASGWTDCAGTEVTGLANGTYYVRIKASGTALASDDQTVTVAAYIAPKTLSSIAVTTAPAKVTYTAGEYFDTSGMVVTATYSDGSTEAVVSYTFTPTGALTTDDTSITISYTEGGVTKTATQAITVNEVLPEFTITFDGNGGTPSVSGMTTTGQRLATLPTATRSGRYSFKGWYTASSGGTQVTTDTVFTADTTIYAQWNYIESTGGGGGTTRYTVKFETNGGSKITSQSVTRNTAVNEPTVPTKDGYIFAGWYSDKELKTAYDFSEKVTKSFTLYAKWTEKEKEPDKPTQPVEPIAPGWENPFTDVSENDWFYDSVRYVTDNNLMNGVSDSEFAPNETLTRAMLVTVLYRNEGEPATNRGIPFADVDMGSYYGNAVSWAKQNGIVSGVTENNFAPDTNITREQIATIMYRYAQYNGMNAVTSEENLHFTDGGESSEYAVSAMNWAVGTGLMKGKSATTINPKDIATRAEIAAILQRFIEANK